MAAAGTEVAATEAAAMAEAADTITDR
jgi:hypothetical protein